MNPPVANFYDPANAAHLALLAAESYRPRLAPGSNLVDSASTDTHAVITDFPGDRIVAFRGTADLRNWLTDLDCEMTPLCWASGKVHRGFAAALESIAAPLDAALDPADPRRIWITGHSLGGALAMLFALRLKLRRGVDAAGVYTFGQPRVGNIPFSLGYDKSL
jgi:triacylglycerol lipase